VVAQSVADSGHQDSGFNVILVNSLSSAAKLIVDVWYDRRGHLIYLETPVPDRVFER
jgi:hypothetical protein